MTRLIYGQPCPIWLNRTDGPLRATSVELGAGGVLNSRLPTQEGGWTDAAVEPPHGHAFVQACKGGHQGCPLATNQCILPYHLTLHEVQARHPDIDIACLADDTYHPPPTLRAHARSTVFTTITTPLSRSSSTTFQVRRQHGALSCTLPRPAAHPLASAHASAVGPAASLDPLRPRAPNGQRMARHRCLTARRGSQHPNTVCASPDPNPNPAPYQVEVPAPETPKRASAAAELPQTEVRTKRTCAGRKAAAK